MIPILAIFASPATTPSTAQQLAAAFDAAAAIRADLVLFERDEPRRERRAARLHTLQDVMADTLGDAGWLETELAELESWFSVDDELTDREWIEAAKQALIDASVLPEHSGAPLAKVRDWNDVFISTYRHERRRRHGQ